MQPPIEPNPITTSSGLQRVLLGMPSGFSMCLDRTCPWTSWGPTAAEDARVHTLTARHPTVYRPAPRTGVQAEP